RIQRELHRLSGENAARVVVRCGWNVFEPALAGDVLEGLRHAIRGAALVARVEERRALVLSAVTHELRTPLTSIIGFSERLQTERATRGQQARWLGTIAEEARRLHRLADGLIDIGAWSAGGLKLRLAACSLRSVANDAARVIAERAKQRGVPIIVAGRARVIADRDRLFQVVINLLENALRHTPGGRSIRVHIRGSRRQATLTIRDGGPGFSAAERAAAGTPFSAGPEGKTGLGLAIARILIEAHGGELRLGGGKAQGGLVSVTLPLEQNAAPRRVAGANIRL
ncbi:MAG TPA: HAMP domain-containing sensor histidine kinase, partial [Candidatus Eremiobacteraceae bacterium]|nr:HAMP domain-containing sensor histidine kinase [Candidatus Eremiobacteraceae bacterium]